MCERLLGWNLPLAAGLDLMAVPGVTGVGSGGGRGCMDAAAAGVGPKGLLPDDWVVPDCPEYVLLVLDLFKPGETLEAPVVTVVGAVLETLGVDGLIFVNLRPAGRLGWKVGKVKVEGVD